MASKKTKAHTKKTQPSGAKVKGKTIAVVGLNIRSLYNTRFPLLKSLRENGFEVVVLAPDVTGESILKKDIAAYRTKLRADFKALGIKLEVLPKNGTKIPVLSLNKYRSIFRETFSKHKVTDTLVFQRDAANLVAQSIDIDDFASFTVVLGARHPASEQPSGFLTKGLFSGLKTVISFCRNSMQDRSLKYLSKHATKFIVQNPRDAEYYVTSKLIDQDKIVVVNGAGVDLDHYAEQPLNQVTPLTFLYVGKIEQEKGFYEYCEAVQIVRKTYPGMRFNAIGGLPPKRGRDAQFFVNLAQESGVNYAGDVLDVRPHYHDAHIIVFPSHGEATSKALLEALAIGRPIITTNVSGCEQTVTPQENGVVVNVSDPWAISHAMTYFIESSDQLQSMAKASRKLAETKFNIHNVNQDIVKAIMTT